MFEEIGRVSDEPMERGVWLLYRGVCGLLWLAALWACLWRHGVPRVAYPWWHVIYPVVYSVMVVLSLKWFATALKSAPPTVRQFQGLRSVSALVFAVLNVAFVLLN